TRGWFLPALVAVNVIVSAAAAQFFPTTPNTKTDKLPAARTVVVPTQRITVPPTPSPPKKLLPPPVYDRHYEGDLTLRVVSTLEELNAVCRVGHFIQACASRHPLNCVVYMVKDEVMREYGYNTGQLLRHEIGHCNGWPNDHPDEQPGVKGMFLPRAGLIGYER